MCKKKKRENNLSVRYLIKQEGFKGGKTRKEIANRILKKLHENNITHNKKGNEITIKKILIQFSGLINDVKTNRGRCSNSWTSNCEWIETKEICSFRNKNKNSLFIDEKTIKAWKIGNEGVQPIQAK